MNQRMHDSLKDDDNSDTASIMMTDVGASASQLGSSSAVADPNLGPWEIFSSNDL